MAARALAFPPGSNGMGGEGRRIVGDADADSATIVGRVVNAVGDAHAAGIGLHSQVHRGIREAIPERRPAGLPRRGIAGHGESN